MSRCAHADRKGRQCRRGAHAFGFHVYSKLAQVGRKRKREQVAVRDAREVVRERSEGWCEAHGLMDRFTWGDVNGARKTVCGTILLHAATEIHHLWPEDRDLGRHEAERLLHICRAAHIWSHGHPTAASALGLLRPGERSA